MYTLEELNTKKVTDLKVIATELNLKKFEKLKKDDLAYAILDHQAENAKSQAAPEKEQKPRTNKPKNQNPKKRTTRSEIIFINKIKLQMTAKLCVSKYPISIQNSFS